jgi:cysteine desulfurase
MHTNDFIYMDYSATSPVDPIVFETMLPFLKQNFANPSSAHFLGKNINEKINEARNSIATLINSDSSEIIFTSGATEAINIGIKGLVENYLDKGKHIVTVSSEHKAVIDTCKELENKGYEVTYLPVLKNGMVDLLELEQSIRHDTILVCVMYVNNETGVIQPIKKISELAHNKGALFMTDATQAVGKLPIDIHDLDIDLLSFSGHKIYGPKGVGALFFRRRGRKVKLSPQIHGGGHEQGLRSGTLNVPGIIALGKACEIANYEMQQNENTILTLRDRLEKELLQIPNTYLNGDKKNRIFNISNICFVGQDANVLIGRLKNVAVSNGSACSSAIVEPSHVLSAMMLSNEDAFASLRFSLGKFNTLDDVNKVIEKLKLLIV